MSHKVIFNFAIFSRIPNMKYSNKFILTLVKTASTKFEKRETN